jgi:hypothetical protein
VYARAVAIAFPVFLAFGETGKPPKFNNLHPMYVPSSGSSQLFSSQAKIATKDPNIVTHAYTPYKILAWLRTTSKLTPVAEALP